MCTGNDGMPGSVAEALRMTRAGLDYLNGQGARELRAIWAGGHLPPEGAARGLLAHVAGRRP